MKLFLRIFLGFWLSTILMFGVLLNLGEGLRVKLPGDRERGFEPDVVASDLSKAVNAYELHGEAAFRSEIQNSSEIIHSSFYLFDQQGTALVKDGMTPPLYQDIAADVFDSGRAKMRRFGRRTIFVCPIQSATGKRYVAIVTVFEPLYRLANPRFWFNLVVAMFPAALVCMLLSLYITHPITKLRATALRLAGGDLSARATRATTTRKDELGDLARDFDMMAAQIESLMTAQRRFVADVSHELGAPLTRMHLALALLRRQFAGRNIGEVERIERETDKLSNLVQQLLLLAGLEAGARPAETLAPISMRPLCESIIDDANFEATHAHCVVTGSRHDITLLAYPQLLRRAIDNVLRNAIRYSPAGSEISLDCMLSDDRENVVLEVVDCGPGVPEPMLSDIFRPFFRTAPGRESTSGGTGLGLAIASEAIRLHEGMIAAKNRKSGGLQVTITFPLRIPAPEQEAVNQV